MDCSSKLSKKNGLYSAVYWRLLYLDWEQEKKKRKKKKIESEEEEEEQVEHVPSSLANQFKNIGLSS